MSEQLSNKAVSSLSGTITNAVTSLTVTSATGFPTSGDFRIIVKAEGSNTDEIMTVTAVSGTTFTVTRASEAVAGVQTASAHTSGAVISHVLTAGALRSLNIPYGFIGARAYRTTDQTGVVTSTDTKVAWDNESYDTDGFHSNVTNNSRMTIPAGLGGKYLLTANVIWDTNTTNIRQVWFFKNNGGIGGFDRVNPTTYAAQNISDVLDLIPGDYIEVNVYQDSGSNRTLSASITAVIEFSIVKLDAGRVGSGIGASVTEGTSQSIPDATFTALAFNDADLFDTDGFHDPATNNSRFTIPAGMAGKYLCVAQVCWESNASGIRQLYVRKNGTDYTYAVIASATSTTTTQITTAVLDLAAGDYVEGVAYQNSGGSRGTAANVGNAFQIMRLDTVGRDVSKTVRGGVSGAGAVTKGSGFTSSKLSTGRYQIVFSTAFSSLPVVTVTSWMGTFANNEDTCRVWTGDGTNDTSNIYIVCGRPNSAFVDMPFDFIAMSVD